MFEASLYLFLELSQYYPYSRVEINILFCFAQKQNSKTEIKHDEMFHSPPQNVVQ
jgi:hypothetical protein